MDKQKILEIAKLAHHVADVVPTAVGTDGPRVTNLFQEYKGLAGVCMQDLDVRPDLKNVIEPAQYGEFYKAVRYFHSTSHYSVNMANEVKQKALIIAKILESAAAKLHVVKGTGDYTMVENTWMAIQKDYDISKRGFGIKINFVTDQFKRKTIFRDVEHAYALASLGYNKPAVILSGSIIEELLRLYLEYKGVTLPKNDFDGYIKACEQNGLLKSAVNRLTDSVRQFRNFVHMQKEISSRHTISKATAKGAVSSIFTIVNDFH